MNRILFFILMVSAVNAMALPAIYLKKKIVTEKERILLSDIATLDSSVADRVIVENLSQPEYISTAKLSLLLDHFPEESIYGEGVSIFPLNKELDCISAQNMLQSELKERGILHGNEYRITCEEEKKLLYPEFNGITKEWASLPNEPNSGLRMILLKFMQNNEIIHSLRIKFLFEKKIKAAIPLRLIKRGERMGKEDVRVAEIYTDSNEKNYFESDVTGYTALTDLEPGKIIHIRQIRNSKPVEKGSKINIVYIGSHVVVKANANALESGEIGDMIKIRRGARTLTGRISGSGLVTIE